MKEQPPKELTSSLIEFPCEFPLKIFGLKQEEFTRAVLEVVLKHDPGFSAANMEMRTSKKARYLSLTCPIQAVSQIQLDALYQELCDHPSIVMVL